MMADLLYHQLKIMYLLLIIVCVILLGEAYIEASFGDRRHWPSLVITVLGSMIASAVVQGTFHGLISTLFFYIAARMWFDLVFNYLKGNKWSYLGNNFTDRWLRKVPPLAVLFGRVIISFPFLVAGISELQQHFYLFYDNNHVAGWLAAETIIIMLLIGGVIYKRQND
jgi:hypothetical protein